MWVILLYPLAIFTLWNLFCGNFRLCQRKSPSYTDCTLYTTHNKTKKEALAWFWRQFCIAKRQKRYKMPCLFSIFRHNDLPWNIRKFIHNKLNTVNFTSNLKTETPWGTSPWSHTDLTRLVNGRVGGQVCYFFYQSTVIGILITPICYTNLNN